MPDVNLLAFPSPSLPPPFQGTQPGTAPRILGCRLYHASLPASRRKTQRTSGLRLHTWGAPRRAGGAHPHPERGVPLPFQRLSSREPQRSNSHKQVTCATGRSARGKGSAKSGRHASTLRRFFHPLFPAPPPSAQTPWSMRAGAAIAGLLASCAWSQPIGRGGLCVGGDRSGRFEPVGLRAAAHAQRSRTAGLGPSRRMRQDCWARSRPCCCTLLRRLLGRRRLARPASGRAAWSVTCRVEREKAAAGPLCMRQMALRVERVRGEAAAGARHVRSSVGVSWGGWDDCSVPVARGVRRRTCPRVPGVGTGAPPVSCFFFPPWLRALPGALSSPAARHSPDHAALTPALPAPHLPASALPALGLATKFNLSSAGLVVVVVVVLVVCAPAALPPLSLCTLPRDAHLLLPRPYRLRGPGPALRLHSLIERLVVARAFGARAPPWGGGGAGVLRTPRPPSPPRGGRAAAVVARLTSGAPPQRGRSAHSLPGHPPATTHAAVSAAVWSPLSRLA